MGNRAHLQIIDRQGNTCGAAIYLHWNGGLESVAALVHTAKKHNLLVHSPEYATANLAALARLLFGFSDGYSVGVQTENTLHQELGALGAQLVPSWCEENGFYIFDLDGNLAGHFQDLGTWDNADLQALESQNLRDEYAAALQADRYAAVRLHLDKMIDTLNQADPPISTRALVEFDPRDLVHPRPELFAPQPLAVA